MKFSKSHQETSSSDGLQSVTDSSPVWTFFRSLLPVRVASLITTTILGRHESLPDPGELAASRGENLYRLQKTQNRIITGIYRLSLAAFVAFFMILISFSLFMVGDPHTPLWLNGLLGTVQVLLLVGFIRTVVEFKTYRRQYADVSERLQQLVQQQRAKNPMGEHRMLTSLKPREHSGWDAKTCKGCQRAIELATPTCPHCGAEQDPLLAN
ncbi:MAG: zinc ribbon domain-containing protein [Deltaproteobacteria bacterium]|nr:zinc ribbon domain-containing protein [Deltaproteobacteria bacterium]